MTAAVGARNLFKVDAGVVHALLNARYYDSSRGQFASEDPMFLIMGDASAVKQLMGRDQASYLGDPQQLNAYSYARGNPVNAKDPSGLGSTWWETFFKGADVFGQAQYAYNLGNYFLGTTPQQQSGDGPKMGLETLQWGAGYLVKAPVEPPRDCRRLFGLSYAAMAGCSSMA